MIGRYEMGGGAGEQKGEYVGSCERVVGWECFEGKHMIGRCERGGGAQRSGAQVHEGDYLDWQL